MEQHLADLIAAGEVVERPASVVKELLENAIDAEAKVITIEITSAGMTFIRVTDNGCGIAPGDVTKAFLRHATSKLQNEKGLEAIGTLGFRGEALAAIVAVSRIEMLTRETGSREGVSISLEAGEVLDISPTGCPEGTTIIVRDLFYNTPARQKFMKSDKAESAAVTATVLRCALSRPDVSIRYIKDGKTEYHTPGDSRVDSCVYSLLGRDFSLSLIPAETADEDVMVKGFVSSPSASRGNRSLQFFFVNGRAISSRILGAALEQAYLNMLPSGRFPSCVLYITTKLSSVDVNVHPAKTEVKFMSDKQVFDGVRFAALGAISAQRPGNAMSEVMQEAKEGLYENQTPHFAGQRFNQISMGIPGDGVFVSEKTRAAYHVPDDTNEPHMNQVDYFHRSKGHETQFPHHRKELLDIETGARSNDIILVGEALTTYIIAEYRGSVWFIDKHAAHERIHFDALRRANYLPMSQALITPVICRHSHEGVALLLENTALLEELGFSVESFGDDAVAVRRIPSDIEISDTEIVLSDICACLDLGGVPEPSQRDAIYKVIACKAAIKSGKDSNRREIHELATRVLSGEVTHCPHGRPVSYELAKTTLDKGFGRT